MCLYFLFVLLNQLGKYIPMSELNMDNAWLEFTVMDYHDASGVVLEHIELKVCILCLKYIMYWSTRKTLTFLFVIFEEFIAKKVRYLSESFLGGPVNICKQYIYIYCIMCILSESSNRFVFVTERVEVRAGEMDARRASTRRHNVLGRHHREVPATSGQRSPIVITSHVFLSLYYFPLKAKKQVFE